MDTFNYTRLCYAVAALFAYVLYRVIFRDYR